MMCYPSLAWGTLTLEQLGPERKTDRFGQQWFTHFSLYLLRQLCSCLSPHYSVIHQLQPMIISACCQFQLKPAQYTLVHSNLLTTHVARGLTVKSFRINPSSSNFPCVTQTKRIGPLEMNLPEFFRTLTLKFFPLTFFHPFFRFFLWDTLGNKKLKFSGFWNFSCVIQN